MQQRATFLGPRGPYPSLLHASRPYLSALPQPSGRKARVARFAFQSSQPQPQDGLPSPASIHLPLQPGIRTQPQPSKLSPLKATASNYVVSVETAAQAASFSRVPILGGMLSSCYLLYKRFENLWGSFLPMVALFFFLSFVNTILDSLKDTFVITAVGGGAQVIPYLTVYAVLPSSLLFLFLYSYATNHMSRSAVFNTIICVFMSFFALFGLILYPNHQTLHLHHLADTLNAILPSGLAGAVGMIQNWTFTLFFCMAELWGDVCLSLLFWGLANDTTHIADAPTLYPLFGLGANMAQAMAGIVLKLFSSPGSSGSSFSSEVQAIMGLVMVFSCVVLVMHNYIIKQARKNAKAAAAAAAPPAAASPAADPHSPLQHAQARSNGVHPSSSNGTSPQNGITSSSGQCPAAPTNSSSTTSSSVGSASQAPTTPSSTTPTPTSSKPRCKKKKKKPKTNLSEVWRILLSSIEIRCLAVMSIAQGLCTSLMEFTWKCHIKILYPSPSDFTAFLGDVATWTGVVTGCLMVLSPLLFDKLGWRNTASATPQILTYGGGVFFALCIAYQWIYGQATAPTALSLAILNVLVVGGALLYIFSKGAKFSLFKPAEEMVYIGMDEEGRTKGKAAIDVVGAQTGKSAGSMLQQALLIISAGSIHNILPVMAVMFLAMCNGWVRSVDTLAQSHDFSKHFSMPGSSLSTVDEEGEVGGSGRGSPEWPQQQPQPQQPATVVPAM